MPLPNPISYNVAHRGVKFPPAKPYAYWMASNGVFKLADTPYFSVTMQVMDGKRLPGLMWFDEDVELHVPRIPARWLATVLDDARRVGQAQRTAVEQMYHFHYLPGGWRVERPRQTASAARVTYQGGDAPSIVLDLHSHHFMQAFYSRTDNRDEQGCRFYAVLGRIYDRPEIRLRVGVYGDFLDLPASVLFEGLGEVEDKYGDR